MKKLLAFLSLLPLFASAQDFGAFTEITTFPPGSVVLVQTGNTAGLRFTRKI